MTSAAGMVSITGAAPQSIHSLAVSKIGRSLVSKSYYLYEGLSEEENFNFDLRAFLIERGCDKIERTFGGVVINDYALLASMLRCGGFKNVVEYRRLREVARHLRGPRAVTLTSASSTLHQYYSSQLYAYEHALVYGREAPVPEIPRVTRPCPKAPYPPNAAVGPLKPLGAGVTSSLLKKKGALGNAPSSSVPDAMRASSSPPGPPLVSTGTKKLPGSSASSGLAGSSLKPERDNREKLRKRLKVFAPSSIAVVRAADYDRSFWRPVVAGRDSDVLRQCRVIVYTSRREIAVGQELLASFSGVAQSRLRLWLDGRYQGSTDSIEARMRPFLNLYYSGQLNHLLPGNAGLLTPDEMKEMNPLKAEMSETRAHSAPSASFVAPDPAKKKMCDRANGNVVAVVAKETTKEPFSTPQGTGKRIPSPVTPRTSLGRCARPSRPNGDIVKPRSQRIRKSKSKAAVQLRDLMRLNPEVSLQFLERQTSLSPTVIEQFLDASTTGDTRRVTTVMSAFLTKFEGIVDRTRRAGGRARPSGQKRPSSLGAPENIVAQGLVSGWERCEIVTGEFGTESLAKVPPQGLLAPPPSPLRE